MDGSIRVWSLASGGLLKTIQLPSQVLCAALDPSELFVYAGCSDGRLYEACLSSMAGEEVRGSKTQQQGETASPSPFSVLDSTKRDVTCLAMSGDGTMLLAGCQDGVVRVYDVESRQCLRSLKHPTADPVSGEALGSRTTAPLPWPPIVIISICDLPLAQGSLLSHGLPTFTWRRGSGPQVGQQGQPGWQGTHPSSWRVRGHAGLSPSPS